MNRKTFAFTAAACAVMAVTSVAQARDQIQVAGSSTVLPFSSQVAEAFGKTFNKYKTPVVAGGGSSTGLKQFCQGVGEATIDIANSSRAIRKEEVEACNKAGVKDIHEVKFGYDGIVFASRAQGPGFALTPKDVFLALAAEVPMDGKMVKNPHSKWSDVNNSLPNQDIMAFIPGENHGTREVFEEKVLIDGCKSLPEVKAMDSKAQGSFCKAVRKDGRVVDIAGDYTETLARLDSNPQGVGVFGLSFYENNRDKLRVATVDGVEPSLETIATGKYPVSRPLFFYVKGAHLGVIPGLGEYVQFFLSDQMAGQNGALVERGLIPMPDQERAAQLQAFKDKKTVSASR